MISIVDTLEELQAAMREQQSLMRRLLSRMEDEGQSAKGSSTSSAGEGAAATIDAGDGAAGVREEADVGI